MKLKPLLTVETIKQALISGPGCLDQFGGELSFPARGFLSMPFLLHQAARDKPSHPSRYTSSGVL